MPRTSTVMALALLLAIAACTLIQASYLTGGALDNAEANDRPEERTVLVVFAAASLNEAFTQIGAQFERLHPHVQLVFNFAGSQQLAQQLAQGAPADVFASADQRQMHAALEAQRVQAEGIKTFAGNQLVIVYPLDNPAELVDWRSIAQPGVKLALAAEAVPVGHYTQIFLEAAGRNPHFGEQFKRAVYANVITYDENVRSVLSRVILGEVDAGIVYSSDVLAAPGSSIGWLPIPDIVNVTAGYYIAPVSNSSQPALAGSFIDFVCSAGGQEILQQNGFTTGESVPAEIIP